jgi:hypothetical protein
MLAEMQIYIYTQYKTFLEQSIMGQALEIST